MNRPPLPPAARVALVLATLTILAYANSFGGPYFFDDSGAIVDNPTIRHFGTALAPLTNGTPVSGRPLLNLTFSLNYAVSGLAVWSYHLTNLAIHLLAVLTLFGLIRRTLLRPALATRWGGRAIEIAGATALLWGVHPLQTESVTYLSQRAESLMGLCYLFTLYAFVRGVESGDRRWLAGSVAACLAGMASKEVMISAPLLVLLYDRLLVAGSFARALRQRPVYYGALGATWLLLALEMVSVGNRGGAVGTVGPLDAEHYALTQCHALALYLGLCFWPHPLTFDYGTYTVAGAGAVVPEAALVLILLGVTAWLLARGSALGFLGAWFFAILAPSSSLVPLGKQTMAEHRMYLPLAAVSLAFVLAVATVGRARWAALLALPLLVLTLLRNAAYLDGLTLWSESAARYPDNPRAHINLGNAYVQTGRWQLGKDQFEWALRLDPNLPEAHNDLGVVEAHFGEKARAESEYRAALWLAPGWDKPRTNLNELGAAGARPGAR